MSTVLFQASQAMESQLDNVCVNDNMHFLMVNDITDCIMRSLSKVFNQQFFVSGIRPVVYETLVGFEPIRSGMLRPEEVKELLDNDLGIIEYADVQARLIFNSMLQYTKYQMGFDRGMSSDDVAKELSSNHAFDTIAFNTMIQGVKAYIRRVSAIRPMNTPIIISPPMMNDDEFDIGQ